MTMTTELELLTQIEILKTDMGKVQSALRDMTVARDTASKILMNTIALLMEKGDRSECC